MSQSMDQNTVNPRLTENTCEEPEASLMPLEDYQHLDLVPLETATEPIKSHFRNLPRDVWIAKNASKKPADGLTADESAAIHLYTMEVNDQPLYSLLNKSLRDRDRRKLKVWFSYLKLFLTALFKLPPCSAKIVWRGVKADLQSKYHRGEHYTWWAFSSCTLSLEALEQPMYLGTSGTRTLFSIECLNGKNIKPHSYYKTEDEILLLPGFYFEVVSKVKAGHDLHIIQLREVIPPFTLLEPPFNIHQSISVSSVTSTIDETINKIYEMNKDNDDMYKLFVVLPNPLFDWNSGNLFENHFVIHFVCECSTKDLHFTCHPACDVPNPRIFFQIYGKYMEQFMISLTQHLFDHQIIDRFHDTHFWSVYMRDLDKMKHILDVVEYESATVKQASDTSKLRELLVPCYSWMYLLCCSITAEMNIRWVCMNHYPTDQLELIHQLDGITEVKLNIFRSSLEFTDEIDSTKMSRICNVLGQGLRLRYINLSNLKSSVSVVEKLKKAVNQASTMSVYFSRYLREKASGSDLLQIANGLTLCRDVITSNRRIKHADIQINDVYTEKNSGIADALRSNRNISSLSYGVNTTSEGLTQIISALADSRILTTLDLKNNTLSSENLQSISAMIRSSRTLFNLTLSKSKIMDEGMLMIVDAICVNPILKKLNVSGNDLSDRSAAYIIRLLKTCSSLTNLDISDNKITIIGAQLIFDELQINRTLLHFNIGSNHLSADEPRKTLKYHESSIIGVGELIARVLLKNTTLCSLDMFQIVISENDLRPLNEALMKNRTLANLTLYKDSCSRTLSQPVTNVLHWNNSLISLNLSVSNLNGSDHQKLSEILRKNNKLRFLDLSHCKIMDNGMSILAEGLRNNHALTHLDLNYCELTNISGEVLGKILQANSNLTYLHIGSNKIGDNGMKEIVRALSDDCSLTFLNIINNNITNTGGESIAPALKTNKTLLQLDIIFGNNLSLTVLTGLRTIRRNLQIT